ncbi:MAG: dihydrofolate reductase [Oscillospiraceae bacterium]|nr:dihydrofolate reductase [Oscillospiraceae bacterium]
MIYIIAAVAKNNVIGKNGGMPWHIPEELKHFRELTMGSAVVMGRRTYESIGQPLPGRVNIVVSNSQEFQGENLTTANSLSHAIQLAGDRDVFVSGGRQLYKEAIEIADVLYITEIEMETEGDTFFPPFDHSLFDRAVEATFDTPVKYSYVTYVRKK